MISYCCRIAVLIWGYCTHNNVIVLTFGHQEISDYILNFGHGAYIWPFYSEVFEIEIKSLEMF